MFYIMTHNQLTVYDNYSRLFTVYFTLVLTVFCSMSLFQILFHNETSIRVLLRWQFNPLECKGNYNARRIICSWYSGR